MISVEHMDELITRFKSGELDIRDIIEQSYFGGRADREKELSELPNEYSEKLWKNAFDKGKAEGAREFAEWLTNYAFDHIDYVCNGHFINRQGRQVSVDEVLAEYEKEKAKCQEKN